MSLFKGIPRSLLLAEVSEMPGFRHLGERILAQAKSTCPQSDGDNDSESDSGHLVDALEMKLITGADPRLLIGSSSQGEKLGWVTLGTDPHPIDAVNGPNLVFDANGETVFTPHVDHPGTQPNSFILDAAGAIVRGG